MSRRVGWFTVLCLTFILCCSFVSFVTAEELSRREKAYLEEKGTIVFVSQSVYPPFEFIDREGEHIGMSIELARWISTEFGFKTRFTDTVFKEAQDRILHGEADVLTSFFYSKKRDRSFDFTDQVFEVPASIFVAHDRPDIMSLHDLNGKTIAMQRGDYAREFLESRNLIFKVAPTANFAEAADLVIAGKADAMIGDEQIVLYHIYTNNLTESIKKVGEPLYVGQNCMSVVEGNSLLHSILQKGIDRARKQGVLESINRKWLGITYTMQETFWGKYRFVIVGVICSLIFLVLFIWIWNTRLRQEVEIRTKELSESRKTLQTILKALPVGVAILRGRKISWLNNSFMEMVRYRQEELIGRSARILYADPDRFRHDGRILAEMVGNEEYSPFETAWVRKDGTSFTCLLRYAQVMGAEDEKIEIAIAEDITERKDAENKLRRAKEEWERTFDTVPDLIMIMDEQYAIQRMNKAMAQALNVNDIHYSNRRCYEYVHGTEEPPEYCPHSRLLQDGQQHTVETYEENLDGHFIVSVTPLYDEDNTLLGSVHVARDITERKQHEERVEKLSSLRARLMRSQGFVEKIRCIIDALQGLFTKNSYRFHLLCDGEGRNCSYPSELLSHSRGKMQIDGYHLYLLSESDELKDIERAHHPVSRERGYIRDMLQGGIGDIFHAGEAKEGNSLQQYFSGKLIHSANKEIYGVLSIFSDTPLKSIENGLIESISETVAQVLQVEINTKTLRDSEKRFRQLFESLIDVYFKTNRAGEIQLVSPSVEQVLGYKPQEMIGNQTTLYYADPDDRQKLLDRTHAEGVLSNTEVQMKKRDGAVIWVSFNAKPLFDETGEYDGIEGLFRDVTRNKQAEELLRFQRDLATAFTHISSLDKALEICLDAVMGVDEVDCAGIYLNDNNSQTLHLQAHRNIPEQFVELVSSLEKNSPQANLVFEGEAMFANLPELMSNWGLSIEEQEKRLRFGLRAFGCIPLIHENSVIGCLNIASTTTENFKEFSQFSIEAIAFLIGAIISKINAEQALKTSQRNLNTLFESLDDFLFILDDTGTIIGTNPSVVTRLGYSEEELRGQSVLQVHPPELGEKAVQIIDDMVAGKTEVCPIPLITRDGQRIPVETKVNRGTWDDKPALFGISRDISKRLEAEEAKRQSEELLSTAIEAIDEGFVIYDPDDRLLLHNSKYKEINTTVADLLQVGTRFEDILRAGLERGHYAGLDGNSEEWIEKRMRLHHEGNYMLEQKIRDGRWIRISERKMQDGSIVGFRVDVTDVKQATELAEKALREKEVLLREIHHRVKNNMQVVSSLLSLQAAKIEDNHIQEIFADAQARVQSMALVHETLYCSDDLARINYRDYVGRLIDQITYLFSYHEVQVDTEGVGSELVLPIEQAAICGLILVELVTNSFKYAFPSSGLGKVRVGTRMKNEGEAEMTIVDNGVGIPDGLTPQNGSTLGLRMVAELVEDQLEGQWELDGSNGTQWVIRWPLG